MDADVMAVAAACFDAETLKLSLLVQRYVNLHARFSAHVPLLRCLMRAAQRQPRVLCNLLEAVKGLESHLDSLPHDADQDTILDCVRAARVGGWKASHPQHDGTAVEKAVAFHSAWWPFDPDSRDVEKSMERAISYAGLPLDQEMQLKPCVEPLLHLGGEWVCGMQEVLSAVLAPHDALRDRISPREIRRRLDACGLHLVESPCGG